MSGSKLWSQRYRDDPYANDFSSTESTPNHPADTEDTPEPPAAKLIEKIRTGSVAVARPGHERSRSKGKRGSLWPWQRQQQQQQQQHTSRDQQVVLQSDAAAERPSKRKRQESERVTARGHDWDHADSRPSSADSPAQSRFPFPDPAQLPYGFFPAGAGAGATAPPGSVLGFLQAHPQLPDQLARWVQFGVSTLAALAVVGVVAAFLLFVRTEIDHKADAAMRAAAADIADCRKEWRDNGCAGPVGPAFQRQCDAWADCMHRDARRIGRASISASTLADILNAFFEPLSWKLLVRCPLPSFALQLPCIPTSPAAAAP